ncbi:hypothetical protein Moror_3566 [Moniliophthora roreri MCA 2997]|uniref:GAR domain-containing protein n=2 Tax=Moniliophthora roreri TaxID=221103 RepID=V2WXD5_MONRO|nr:hypothetical protein Moror_3566 [Moniliophthora roreri MCA 2997]KAI3619801.1 hypothetical protein WG66_002855 [Moniliophthora roreri]
MPALSLSSSRTSLASLSRNDYAPPSPASVGSASSSKLSLDQQDEENITITAKRSFVKNGKQKSQEDLRLLAVSTHMTELSYMISDIQTRIFEIQELRHKNQSSGDTAGTTSIIDQSLMSLDEKLEAVSKGMKTVNDALEPILQATPTIPQERDGNGTDVIMRKHATLVSEWEAVQDESDVLREELKEDKWLTVFRTVTDQADGMMSSLEKGVNRCQEFIWQVHRRGIEDSMGHSQREKSPPTFETFTTLFDSFEAKKKHYMPATSKVLSIIDKGVRDRVTKNGETLRRHAESAQRWKNLKERIARTDADMETVRRILLQGDSAGSETGSSTSGTTSQNGYLATPPSGSRSSRAGSSASAISRSISPFRKFARKLTGNDRSPVTPVTPLLVNKANGSRTPSSEPTLRRQKTSIFRSPAPTTPERPSHKYSQSLTPESSPRVDGTIKARTPVKPVWNSSTKVEPEERNGTIRATPPRRTPSSTGNYKDIPPMPPIGPGTPYRRSLSRTSMASSRPWSPLNSSVSTTHSSAHPPLPTFRPPSRAQTPARDPSRAYTPGPSMTTPRPRPNTPSHIPAPSKKLRSIAGPPSEAGGDDDDDIPTTTLMQRTFSPAFSATSTGFSPPRPPSRSMVPRPPSRSMIPIPSVSLSTPSRPSTAMSSRAESPSPSTTFRSSATRAQTPESALKARAQQVPVYNGTLGRSTNRPSTTRLPPSSYREGSTSRAPSRPGSRTGAFTPSTDNLPMHEYVPGNMNDPLDVEVALVVNSIAHGLLIERVDPPLKKVPKDNEEIKAQYAFSNALSRKVVTCKLTTLTRSGKGASSGTTTTTKKVMCRVGGGWQDLSHYILNRQAGM